MENKEERSQKSLLRKILVVISILIILLLVIIIIKQMENIETEKIIQRIDLEHVICVGKGIENEEQIIRTYEEYKMYIYSISDKETREFFQDRINKFNEEYFESNNLVVLAINTEGEDEVEIEKMYNKMDKLCIDIKITEKHSDGVANMEYQHIFCFKLSKEKNENNIIIKKKLKERKSTNCGGARKPIIYLYPTEETQVNVQLGNKERITCSYPKYTIGWNVIAQPNGDLKDIDTNKNLYSLYYESDNVVEFKVEKDGFVVKGEDSAEFLEEKLKILGLTDREAEEFIIYWLPKLEANKYNYIRFATREEIDANMPLTIKPEPDTTIRVLMEYKGLENSIKVEEQSLETPERKGFVAVEWGGTEIK